MSTGAFFYPAWLTMAPKSPFLKRLFTYLLLSNLGLACAPTRTESMTSSELRQFSEVASEIRKNYIEEITQAEFSKIIDEALNTMVQAGGDPFSYFIPKSEIEDNARHYRGEFKGIGITCTRTPKGFFVIGIHHDSPAEKAGVQVGDQLTEINNVSVKPHHSLSKIVALLRGEKEEEDKAEAEEEPKGRNYSPFASSQVALKLQRKAAPPQVVMLSRKTWGEKTVSSCYPLSDTTGYLKLARFSAASGKEVKTALQHLKTTCTNFSSLIFDLRDNPGGAIEPFQEIAGFFLPKKTVLVIQKTRGGERCVYPIGFSCPFPQLQLILLINAYTASAAEALAISLQETKRAIVVGTHSFGKGLGQSYIRLKKGAAMRFSTLTTLAPISRRLLQKPLKRLGKEPSKEALDPKNWGVIPDIEVTEEYSDMAIQWAFEEGVFYQALLDYLAEHRDEAVLNGHIDAYIAAQLPNIGQALQSIYDGSSSTLKPGEFHKTHQHNLGVAFQAHLAESLWGETAMTKVYNTHSPIFQQALQEVRA